MYSRFNIRNDINIIQSNKEKTGYINLHKNETLLLDKYYLLNKIFLVLETIFGGTQCLLFAQGSLLRCLGEIICNARVTRIGFLHISLHTSKKF